MQLYCLGILCCLVVVTGFQRWSSFDVAKQSQLWRSNTMLNHADQVVDLEQRRRAVIDILSEIIDPDSGDDIVASGRVLRVGLAEDGATEIVLTAKTAKSAVADQIKQFCILQLSMLEWIGKISISVEAKAPPTPVMEFTQKSGIKGVKHVIAVSSCKGGVGKSTVSVNLAFTLRKQGFKVGILDADIYGPSLPTMTRPDTTEKILRGQYLAPLEYEGVKLMSMGFLNQGAAIMRGPMVNQILNQLVTLTAWGDLDYLILDMPPGTGDIQLTLAQIMNISAAVIVTTPQRLSFVDVVKGIDMFDTVNVPSVAVVENMATFDAFAFDDDFYQRTAQQLLQQVTSTPQPQTKDVADSLRAAIEQQAHPRRLFGGGHLDRLREMWGMDHLLSLPLVEELASSGDKGHPYVLRHPHSLATRIFDDLARRVVSEVQRLETEQSNQSIEYDAETHSFYATADSEPRAPDPASGHREQTSTGTNVRPSISAKSLRCRCRCAVCVEEMTGKKLLDNNSVPESIKPLQMAPIGRYAWSIDWSDGHKSLYPFKHFQKYIHEKDVE